MFDFGKAIDALTRQKQSLIETLLRVDGAIQAMEAAKSENEKPTQVTPAEDFEGKDPVK